MSWRVSTICPSCKFNNSLPAAAVLLTRSLNGESNRYSWICVKCRRSNVQGADLETLQALERAGVPEKRTVPAGPPFTPDDVIDLMLELESGKWL